MKLLHTLRRAALAAWLYLLLLSHRWRAWECEDYLAACARDGLTDSLAVREWRAQAVWHRARQHGLQQRLHALRGAGRPGTVRAVR